MPYVPAGSSTVIDVPVGFNLFYDTGSSPAPFVPTLGLASVPEIDSGGIAVDSQNNFIVAATNSSLYGGGPGIVHINSCSRRTSPIPRPSPTRFRSASLARTSGGRCSRVH